MNNGYNTTLPLEVFTQRSFRETLFDWNWILFFKNKKTLYERPFGDLIRGIILTPYVAHWKARSRLPIHCNWTIFAIFYGSGHYKWKSVEVGIFEGVGHFDCKFQREEGVARQPLLVSSRVIALFVWYRNIRSALFDFVTKHACDRRTNRQTPNYRLALAMSPTLKLLPTPYATESTEIIQVITWLDVSLDNKPAIIVSQPASFIGG